jgi:hypothetical protein
VTLPDRVPDLDVLSPTSSGSTDTAILESLLAIDRESSWTLESSTPLAGDIGHPQGLTIDNDRWLVTTVFPREARGDVCVFDRSGDRIREVNVTDGARIHPGGFDSSNDSSLWVAVAEYRPRSTTVVMRFDADFDAEVRFEVADHLGAICDLGDGTLFAVSWGSRSLYRLSYSGDILEQRTNPNHFVDYQDVQLLSPDHILATGVGSVRSDGNLHRLGGLAILDSRDFHVMHEVPVMATMPSGQSITYNGFCVEARESHLVFHCLVDDTTASIGHWTVSAPSR